MDERPVAEDALLRSISDTDTGFITYQPPRPVTSVVVPVVTCTCADVQLCASRVSCCTAVPKKSAKRSRWHLGDALLPWWDVMS